MGIKALTYEMGEGGSSVQYVASVSLGSQIFVLGIVPVYQLSRVFNLQILQIFSLHNHRSQFLILISFCSFIHPVSPKHPDQYVNHVFYKKLTANINDRLKRMEKTYHASVNQKKARIDLLISDILKFRPNKITRENYLKKRGSVHQNNLITLNV